MVGETAADQDNNCNSRGTETRAKPERAGNLAGNVHLVALALVLPLPLLNHDAYKHHETARKDTTGRTDAGATASGAEKAEKAQNAEMGGTGRKKRGLARAIEALAQDPTETQRLALRLWLEHLRVHRPIWPPYHILPRPRLRPRRRRLRRALFRRCPPRQRHLVSCCL